MDISLFGPKSLGGLVPIAGTDPIRGAWQHVAFVPYALPRVMPELSNATFLVVLRARAALAALDSTARLLPNPRLLRLPTLRREAQSTSELEGTYAPLEEVLMADEESPQTPELVEVLNYVRMANVGFDRVADGYGLSVSLLCDLQRILMQGTSHQGSSGAIRRTQVVVGRRSDLEPNGFPVQNARFVPPPPGLPLETGFRDLIDWMREDHSAEIDPVVSAAMSHYQFETIHPFTDGNGRIGRYLIILHLLSTGVLSEPSLTVSQWFESRRTEYYDLLFSVSADGDWDSYVRFFAEGLESAAVLTRKRMIALSGVQSNLKERLRASNLRADSAHGLVDLAIAHPSFTVRNVEQELRLSYTRANKLVGQLVELGVLKTLDSTAYKRRYFAPEVLAVLMQ